MYDPSSPELSRPQLEFMVLASLLRGKKVPLVIDRRQPRLFAQPVAARIVEAIVESDRAQGRVVIDDVKSRLSRGDSAEVDDVIRMSAIICEDDKLPAALEQLEREPPPRDASADGASCRSFVADVVQKEGYGPLLPGYYPGEPRDDS